MAENEKTLSSEDVRRVLWDLYGMNPHEDEAPCAFVAENENLMLFYWAGLGEDDQLLSSYKHQMVEEHISHCRACQLERAQRLCINRGELLTQLTIPSSKQSRLTFLDAEPFPAPIRKLENPAAFRQEHMQGGSLKLTANFQFVTLHPSQAKSLAATLSRDTQEIKVLEVPIPNEAAYFFSGSKKQCRLEIAVKGADAQLKVHLLPRLASEQNLETTVQIKVRRINASARALPELVFSGRPGAQWPPLKIRGYSEDEIWHMQLILKKKRS